MKKLFTLSLLVISGFSFAQDAMFYQKNSVLFHYNPALVGAKSDAAVSVSHRSQWANVYDIYNTNIQGNYNFNNNVGVGLVYQNELTRNATLSNQLILNGNYAKSVNEFNLLVGTNVVWMNSKLSGNFKFEDQINPTSGFINESAEPFESDPVNAFGVDVGLAANYKNFVFGISAMHLNSPDQSIFRTLNTRLVGSLAYTKDLTSELKLGGQAYYQKQAKSQHLSVLANGQYKFVKMGLGVGYPLTSKALEQKITVVIQAGVQFDKWSVAYNYDVWKPNSTTFNSHEISAAWFIKGLKKDSKTSDVLNALL